LGILAGVALFNWAVVDLVTFTVSTPLDIVLHILSYTWLPVVSGYQLCGMVDSRVAVYWCIMVGMDDCPFAMLFACDHSSTIFVRQPFDFLEFVSIDPQAQHVFVLVIYGVCFGHLSGHQSDLSFKERF
jgi:hypothetical protein